MTEILVIILFAIPVIYAVTLHEIAHGYVARLNGDNTAYAAGRLTLNPLKHVDPIGTVVLPAILILFTGVPFGWAKPVPVDWRKLRHPRRDVALVALAGPAANFMMLIVWAMVLSLADKFPVEYWDLGQMLIRVANIGIMINTLMMLLNLIPIPPLDGSRVVSCVLPAKWSNAYNRIEPYGLAVVIVLFFTGGLFSFLLPLVESFHAMVFKLLSFIT